MWQAHGAVILSYAQAAEPALGQNLESHPQLPDLARQAYDVVTEEPS